MSPPRLTASTPKWQPILPSKASQRTPATPSESSSQDDSSGYSRRSKGLSSGIADGTPLPHVESPQGGPLPLPPSSVGPRKAVSAVHGSRDRISVKRKTVATMAPMSPTTLGEALANESPTQLTMVLSSYLKKDDEQLREIGRALQSYARQQSGVVARVSRKFRSHKNAARGSRILIDPVLIAAYLASFDACQDDVTERQQAGARFAYRVLMALMRDLDIPSLAELEPKQLEAELMQYVTRRAPLVRSAVYAETEQQANDEARKIKLTALWEICPDDARIEPGRPLLRFDLRDAVLALRSDSVEDTLALDKLIEEAENCIGEPAKLAIQEQSLVRLCYDPILKRSAFNPVQAALDNWGRRGNPRHSLRTTQTKFRQRGRWSMFASQQMLNGTIEENVWPDTELGPRRSALREMVKVARRSGLPGDMLQAVSAYREAFPKLGPLPGVGDKDASAWLERFCRFVKEKPHSDHEKTVRPALERLFASKTEQEYVLNLIRALDVVGEYLDQGNGKNKVGGLNELRRALFIRLKAFEARPTLGQPSLSDGGGDVSGGSHAPSASERLERTQALRDVFVRVANVLERLPVLAEQMGRLRRREEELRQKAEDAPRKTVPSRISWAPEPIVEPLDYDASFAGQLDFLRFKERALRSRAGGDVADFPLVEYWQTVLQVAVLEALGELNFSAGQQKAQKDWLRAVAELAGEYKWFPKVTELVLNCVSSARRHHDANALFDSPQSFGFVEYAVFNAIRRAIEVSLAGIPERIDGLRLEGVMERGERNDGAVGLPTPLQVRDAFTSGAIDDIQTWVIAAAQREVETVSDTGWLVTRKDGLGALEESYQKEVGRLISCAALLHAPLTERLNELQLERESEARAGAWVAQIKHFVAELIPLLAAHAVERRDMAVNTRAAEQQRAAGGAEASGPVQYLVDAQSLKTMLYGENFIRRRVLLAKLTIALNALEHEVRGPDLDKYWKPDQETQAKILAAIPEAARDLPLRVGPPVGGEVPVLRAGLNRALELAPSQRGRLLYTHLLAPIFQAGMNEIPTLQKLIETSPDGLQREALLIQAKRFNEISDLLC